MVVAEICSFRLVQEGKTKKEISKSSILEFFGKFLANDFSLSDTEDNTSGPNREGVIIGLNREGITCFPFWGDYHTWLVGSLLIQGW